MPMRALDGHSGKQAQSPSNIKHESLHTPTQWLASEGTRMKGCSDVPKRGKPVKNFENGFGVPI